MPIQSNHHLRSVFVGLLLGGLVVVACAGEEPVDPALDARTPVRVTPAQRAVVGEVMRRNLASIHRISTAAAQGDLRTAALLADEASKAPGPGGTDRSLRARLPQGWLDIGKGVDAGFAEIASAARSGGAPARMNAGMASLTGACLSCHTSYRLVVEAD